MTYRYFTTDCVTGRVLADTVPLHVSDFSRNLGGVGQPGTFSGYLDLGALGVAQQAAFVAALEPRRAMLWAVQPDGLPVWGGLLWDQPVSSVQDNKLPVQAKELNSLFTKRQIRTNLSYTSTDLFDVVRNLLSYALTKANGAVGNFVMDVSSTRTLSGTAVSVQFAASSLPKVAAAIDQFCTQYLVEYAYTPGWDATSTIPTITLQLGAPLKRPYADTHLQFLFPSQFVLDYAFPRVGSNSVNSLLATSSQAGSLPWQSGVTHGLNSADFAAGYPLLEDSVSVTTAVLTAQAQIDAYADGQIAKLTGCTTVPSVTVGGGGYPSAGQVQLGDEAELIATSWLHPADPVTGAPGLQQLVRITGWKVQPPTDSQSEQTQFYCGGVTT